MQREIESTEALLAVRKRGLALSEGELARQNSLLTSANVGTQAAVERATQAVIADQERIVGHEGTLAALPRQINVLKAQLATFEVAAETFRLQISRCTVLAPFSAPRGQRAGRAWRCGLAHRHDRRVVDDRVREITVALDFADARRWLHFSDSDGPGALPRPVSTAPRIRWVDAQADQWQSGAVERIASFDPRDRQIGLNHRARAGRRPRVGGRHVLRSSHSRKNSGRRRPATAHRSYRRLPTCTSWMVRERPATCAALPSLWFGIKANSC